MYAAKNPKYIRVNISQERKTCLLGKKSTNPTTIKAIENFAADSIYFRWKSWKHIGRGSAPPQKPILVSSCSKKNASKTPRIPTPSTRSIGFL